MATLAERTMLVVVSRVLTTAIDLVMIVAIARLVSRTDFAILSYLLMVYQTVRYVASLGFPDSVFYFFERISGGARRAFAIQTLTIMLVLASLAGLILLTLPAMVGVLLSSDWTQEQVSMVQRLLPYLAVVALGEIPTWAVPNVLLALDRQRDAAAYSLLMSVMAFVALIAPLAMGWPVESAIKTMALYAIVRLLLSCIWLFRVLPSSTTPLPTPVRRDQIRFAVPIGLSSMVSRLNKYIDKFVVAALLPAEALAHYSVGAQEIPLLSVVPFAVGSVLISRYVRYVLTEDRARLLRLWYESVSKVTLVVVPVGVFLIINAGDFIRVLFGGGYTDAVVPFQIYTAITLHRVTSYGSMLQSFGLTRALLLLSTALVVLNFLLSMVCTLWLGIVGTASAAFVSNMIIWLITLHLIGRQMNIPWHHVLPFAFYLRVLLTAGCCGSIVWILRQGFHGTTSDMALAFSILVYLALFGAAASYSGLIVRDDWQRLLRWLHPRLTIPK
jgi:O-antigen/teichoic acid export membrane protein